MDRALLREGEASPSTGVPGRRTGDDVSNAQAPAAKRSKPRRVSKLKLPDKGKGAVNELFQRSNTAPVRSSLLSDRLSERPASARQLSSVLPGNKRPPEGDGCMSSELERRAGGPSGGVATGRTGGASLAGMVARRRPLATVSVATAAINSASAAAGSSAGSAATTATPVTTPKAAAAPPTAVATTQRGA
ncbi:unnamed protein product, partial [Laminaria digitata]